MWRPLSERPEPKDHGYLIWDSVVLEYRLVGAIDVYEDGSWDWSFDYDHDREKRHPRFSWTYLPQEP